MKAFVFTTLLFYNMCIPSCNANLSPTTKIGELEGWHTWEADKTVSRALSEEEGRQLQEKYQGYMQLCGNNNPCLPGLNCSETGFGRRCMPSRECIQTRMAQFEAKYDLEAYRARVFQDAGISEMSLIEMLKESEDRKKFTRSPAVEAVMQSIRTIWHEPSNDLWAINRECALLDSYNSGNITGRFHEPRVEYQGFHLEGGLLLDASVTSMEATSGSNSTLNHGRTCVGAELIAGGEFAIVVGTAMVKFDCFDGPSFLADIDVGAGINVGVAAGIAWNGNGFLEYSVGLGGGLGVGVSLCISCKSS